MPGSGDDGGKGDGEELVCISLDVFTVKTAACPSGNLPRTVEDAELNSE